MAILQRGLTKCPICGHVIGEKDETILFPHFITNECDPSYLISDGACHSECLKNAPFGSAALAALDEYIKKTRPEHRICAVCSEKILNPDDYLNLLYFGVPPTCPLGKFNFVHLHQSHIKDWKDAKQFLEAAKAAMIEGRWKGGMLSEYIRIVESKIS